MIAAAPYLIWGVVLHLIADWLFQNEWQSINKVNLRHPAAYFHAGIHGTIQLLIFPWWAALAIGVTHLLIDTRKPVVWWSQLIRQTQPDPRTTTPLVDIGITVRFWSDQVWHIAVIALTALVVEGVLA